jgi:hypothetical protein
MRKRKGREAKINNSFTGPYPLDPTDFNHTDKGPNNQFEHMQIVKQAVAEKKRAAAAAANAAKSH